MLLQCPPVATSRAHGRVPRRLQLVFPLVADGSRTTAEQAQWQLCGLVVTLLLAALGGGLTGEFQPRALNIYIYIYIAPKNPTKPPKATRSGGAHAAQLGRGAARWQGKLGASSGGFSSASPGALLRTKVLRSPPERNELESKALREVRRGHSGWGGVPSLVQVGGSFVTTLPTPQVLLQP